MILHSRPSAISSRELYSDLYSQSSAVASSASTFPSFSAAEQWEAARSDVLQPPAIRATNIQKVLAANDNDHELDQKAVHRLYRDLYNAQLEQGKFAEAADSATKLVAMSAGNKLLSEDRPGDFVWLARANMKCGRPVDVAALQNALQSARELTKEDKNNIAEGRLLLSQWYEQHGQPDLAAAEIEKGYRFARSHTEVGRQIIERHQRLSGSN